MRIFDCILSLTLFKGWYVDEIFHYYLQMLKLQLMILRLRQSGTVTVASENKYYKHGFGQDHAK